MKRLVIGLSLLVALVAVAAPRKVLVLALDGNAPQSVRGKLAQSVAKLAHAIEGKVQTGNTTYSETAAAVGCDPNTPACTDNVLSTLGVDEIVWGEANVEGGQLRVSLHRATKGFPAREITATIGEKDAPEKAEPGLQPIFGSVSSSQPPPLTGSNVEAGSGSGSGSGSSAAGSAASMGSGSGSSAESSGSGSGSDLPQQPTPSGPERDYRDRNLGIGLSVGGGLALIAGFLLWESESSTQDEINAHKTNTIDDIHQIMQLEDRAGNYATLGNVFVVAGLVAGGFGAYYLWRDHKHATIAPAPVDHGTGMTLVIGGHW